MQSSLRGISSPDSDRRKSDWACGMHGLIAPTICDKFFASFITRVPNVDVLIDRINSINYESADFQNCFTTSRDDRFRNMGERATGPKWIINVPKTNHPWFSEPC